MSSVPKEDIDETQDDEATRRVGIRELKATASEVIRHVRDRQAPVEVTYRGEVVAKIVPVKSAAKIEEEFRAREERWQRLSEEVTRLWPEGVSAVEAVSEGRSRLDQTGAAAPRPEVDREALERWWTEHRDLARQISTGWPEGVTAVDAIRDVREDGR